MIVLSAAIQNETIIGSPQITISLRSPSDVDKCMPYSNLKERFTSHASFRSLKQPIPDSRPS